MPRLYCEESSHRMYNEPDVHQEHLDYHYIFLQRLIGER